MRKALAALILILFVAGCTASQVDIFLKASPLVNSFLEQYPNAKVTTILVAQGTVQAQIEKIREDCGPDFPVASYYKTTLDDKESGTMLTVWMESASYQIPCAIKETAGVKEEVDANKTIETTTSTMPPTTTTFSTTTTTPAPTTTFSNATSTTSAPAASATTSPAATSAQMPDLEILLSDITNALYNSNFGDSITGHYNMSITIRNRGNADSGAFNTSVSFRRPDGVWSEDKYDETGNRVADMWVSNIPAGGQINKTFFVVVYSANAAHPINNFLMNVSVDFKNQVSESDENNNFMLKNVTAVTSLTTTTTTAPVGPDLTITLRSINGTSPGLRTLSFGVLNYHAGTATGLAVNSTFYIKSEVFYLNNTSLGSCTTSVSSYIKYLWDASAYCQIYFYEKGNYTVKSTVDYTNLISELNENNNENTFVIELLQ